MSALRERLLIDGKRMDARIDRAVTAATLTRTMEGACSLELVVSDPGMRLLRSGVLTGSRKVKRDKLTQASWSEFGRARTTLDGAFFRLARVDWNYDPDVQQLTLGFEDEIATLLRMHKGPMKATRGKVTRGQFVARMVREIKYFDDRRAPRAAYVIPELSEDQPVKGNLPEQRRRQREKGFERGERFTIKGSPADREQKRELETSLTVADEERAGERATLAMLVAGIGESEFRAIMNTAGSGYGGVFQGDVEARYRYFTRTDTEGMARSFLLGGKGFQQGGAIKLAAENPEMSAGEIATRVEASGQPGSFYQAWLEEAEDILAAWGGPGRVRVRSRPYEFRRLGGRPGEDDENSWECIRRLTDEVRWRSWADENVFHLVTDPWLFQNRPVTRITPDTKGIRGFYGSADVGLPVAEVRLKTRTARWVGAPGDCVKLDDLGGLDGRWLIWEMVTDLHTEDTDITLRRPRPALPEPAPDREKITLTETARLERGTVRQRIVQAAKRAKDHPEAFYYLQVRPVPRSLFKRDVEGTAPISGQPILNGYVEQKMDCSGFVTLLYKYAGAPDPNNGDYGRTTLAYTGSLVANGERTSDPQPGDLAFYGSASPYDHVAVYIGGGQAIGFGSQPGPKQHTAKANIGGPFSHFQTYDLGGASDG